MGGRCRRWDPRDLAEVVGGQALLRVGVMLGLILLPEAVRFVYCPIDSHYTVKRLGCGCVSGFNANVFNMFVLLPAVLGVSTVGLVLASRWVKGRGRWQFLASTIFVQWVAGYLCWSACLWL